MILATDIDFDRDGKQVSAVRVPMQRDGGADGALLVPIAVIRNGDGPTLLITAGNHGDEYEGQVAAAAFVRSLDPAAIRGRVIIAPALNLAAATAGRRTSPIDGGNLNRSFPGDALGGPTAKIAAFVDAQLLPRADLVIDLHSGGTVFDYVCCLFASEHPDADVRRRTRQAIDAFGAPWCLTKPFRDDETTMLGSAARRGVPYLSTELRGMGTVGAEALKLAESGIHGLLSALGILPKKSNVTPAAPRWLRFRDGSLFPVAPEDGVFESRCALGQEVEAGDLCGLVHVVERPDRAPIEIRFRDSGVVVGLRHIARVAAGDDLAHVAQAGPEVAA
ncbi:MAG: succinylglutamate desuccinylase/aspartoacylase family protein [Rhodospirillaceae bacterium]|nr:succinylglutamate desuccinylase/aspartoacylase family protein [Rhodospirillaceae bacterium]